MKKRLIPIFFCFGILMLMVGLLFRTMHWPGGSDSFTTGLVLNLLVYILILTEIFRSPKVKMPMKMIWSMPFMLLPLFIIVSVMYSPATNGFMSFIVLAIFVSVVSYLAFGRKKFLQIKGKRGHIEFDSIDV